MEKLTHLSLFSGIGGLDLAAEWAGFETVGQCEWADFPTKVLEKHWPDVPRWRDIRTLNKEDFYERTGRRTVDVISGGFPCQPFSVAGNQKGKEDERYLWPEMLRVIRELTPRWVIGENVPGILHIAAADVVKDLERIGYNVAVFNFEAAAVGARHRRERVFFVANSAFVDSDARRPKSTGQQRKAGVTDGGAAVENTGSIRRDRSGVLSKQLRRAELICTSKDCTNGGCAEMREDVAHNDHERLQAGMPSGNYRKQITKAQHNSSQAARNSNGGIGTWWSVEPNVGRVAHGIPSRVDRLKCLGNAVVPQQAYPIFKAIAELENA
jgi:DNA (cytosine-5)-methyltransferase 1